MYHFLFPAVCFASLSPASCQSCERLNAVTV